MSDAPDSLIPPKIPETLCGVGGCAFTPHSEEYPHTWEIANQKGQS